VASPVLELRSVSLQFANDKVLKNINLKIDKGEIFVVVGPSGHGKSVLLKLMAGIFAPTDGEIWIEGENFYHLSSDARDQLRRKMGMLFQKNALFDSLTAGENIGFPLHETTALDANQIHKTILEYLSAVGLREAENKYPDEISGGMQKRLGIARALALNPEIIFYDDPTAGLDPITSRKIVDLILHFKKVKGATAVAITNDMNRAYQMASRMGMMMNGELIITGTPDETKNHHDPRVHQFIAGLLQGPLTEPA
jgi:phospholipid/cholesterol/gamma-HCH transport system ATP-binding protein